MLESHKIKDLKFSDRISTTEQIKSYIDNKIKTYDDYDYTAFEVFPTAKDILAGTPDN